MKINGITNHYSINPYQNYHKPVMKNSESPIDTVEISAEGMDLLTDDSTRTEKIANIKNQIAAGSYYIHSTDIVDKMLNNILPE